MGNNDVTINIKTKVDNSTDALKALKKSYTELKSGLDIVGAGIQKTQQLFNATTGAYLAQADAVRELSQFTGATATETSKLMEVFDDAGVGVDTLRTGMRMLADEGLEPSIETIAKLADQYRAIESPTERVTFLTETFGARGAELGKVFDLTGDQIREAGENIGNALTDEDIKNAEEIRRAWDSLNDSFAAINNTIQRQLVPGWAALLGGINLVVDAVQNYGEETTAATMSNDEFHASIIETQNVLLDNNGVLADASERYREYADAENESADAARANMDANKAMFEAIDAGIQSTIDKVQEQIDFMNAGGKQFMDSWNQAYAEFLKDPGNPEAQRRIDELDAQSQALQVSLGNISADAAAQNIADTLGLSLEDANVVLQTLLGQLARGATMVVNVVYNDPGYGGGGGGGGKKGGTGGSQPPVEMQASGGHQSPGKPYLVGDGPNGEIGPWTEMVIPNTAGTTLSAAQTRAALSGGGGSPVYITINAPSGYNEQQLAKFVKTEFDRINRQNRASGIKSAGG